MLLLALIIFFLAGSSQELCVTHYTVEAEPLSAPLRLALVTDLHSCAYGEGQSELIEAIVAEQPDALMFAGDIFDDKLPDDKAMTFMQAMAQRYPCYFVSGNHEYRGGTARELKSDLRDMGVTVLEGEAARFVKGDAAINICGVDDPTGVGEIVLTEQIRAAAEAADSSYYTVLLAHRPEYIEDYLAYDFDLVLSGHTHGGQWRIPGLVEGVLAPHQGFFPEYVGGQYDFDSTSMIVSRGLARESTLMPRLYNRPELVIVDLI